MMLRILPLCCCLLFTHLSHAKDFNQVYQQYTASQQTKDHAQTLKLAKQALALGKAKFGEQSANSVNLTYNLASAYAAANQHQNAFDSLQIVTDDFANRHGENSEKHLSALLDQLSFFPSTGGRNLTKLKKILRPKAKQAVAITDHLAQQSAQKAPFYYYQLSRILSRQPLVQLVRRDAIKYTEKAYQGLRDSVGQKDYRTLESQFLLATIKTGTGKSNTAITLYEDLITSISTQLDTSHPYELAARTRLIELYEKKGDTDSATKHCIEIGRMTPWQQELDPMPLYRVEPRYPIEYAKNGKEGWAKLSFSIDPMGFAQDIKIIDVKGGAKFGKAAAKVLEKWRYAPKFADGQAVLAEGLKVQMDFKMGR